MASNKETSLSTQPRSVVLNRSVQESSDSELACQMQLDEVLARSLAMTLPSGSTHDTDDSTMEEHNISSVVGETSRRPWAGLVGNFKEQEPQDAEWIEDDPVLLYNYILGQQRRPGEPDQDHEDVFEALKQQYTLFGLRTTFKSDRKLYSHAEGEHDDEAREETQDDDEDSHSIPFTVESNLPRSEICGWNLPGEVEAGLATCSICLTTEMTSSNSHVVTEECLHRFCTDCLRQHGETMVKSAKSNIPCPEFECEESWSTKMCEFLLSADSLVLLNRRQVEDALADWERVYCPYKDCSWLQLRPPSPRPDQPPPVGGVQCLSCLRYFCLECQVPWHENLTCEKYKALPEDDKSRQDITLLKGLAAEKKWQTCTCGHIVEKTQGCNHITCRCGKEFCYICGEEWTNHLSNVHSCRTPP